METTALQAGDNIPSTFQAPKPYLFYAEQTKPNILERVLLFSQSFMENLPQKYFTILMEPLSWKGMQPLLGKTCQNMTAVDFP